jgi:hypothetical protein
MEEQSKATFDNIILNMSDYSVGVKVDDDERVVIEQRLLKIDEIFIYRIPPMRSADGHRAEDWNLAKPLATCSLHVTRRDNTLCINIMADRPKPGAPAGATEGYVFAQSEIKIDVSASPSQKLEYWVDPVTDSSRYFAVRIKDSKTGREAFIGVGFRERSDATNFRMCLDDYIDSLKREEKAEQLRRRFEESLTTKDGVDNEAVDEDDNMPSPPPSKLSLKEGEKLHINITTTNRRTPKVKQGTGLLGGLKKPPPPPNASPASESSTSDQGSACNNVTSESDVDWGDFEG